MRTIEVLIRARQEMDRRGWTQGYMKNPIDGGVCAMGAIREAAASQGFGGFWWARPSVVRAVSVLQNTMSDIAGHRITIPKFNDIVAWRKQDVEQAFDRAIAHEMVRATNIGQGQREVEVTRSPKKEPIHAPAPKREVPIEQPSKKEPVKVG